MATINFTEATGGPVPKLEVELNPQGGGGLPSLDIVRNVVFLGSRVAAATLAADEVGGPYSTPAEFEAATGAGSPVCCMGRAYFDYYNRKVGYPKSQVYAAVHAEDSGGTAATQTLTFATNADANGTWVFEVGGHTVRVPVVSGDTPTVQAAAFVTQYNALTWTNKPPVTAASAIGVVTLTATVKGAEMNSIGVRTVIDPGIATTDTWGGTSMSGGAGTYDSTELDNVLAALAAFGDAACYVVAYEDDATLELLIDHINTKANAVNKKPSYLFVARDNTVAQLASDAVALDTSGDSWRTVFNGIEGTETWTGDVAATACATANAESHIARSVDGLIATRIGVPPSVADRFTEGDCKTLLESGVTPWYVHPGQTEVGCCRMVMCTDEWGVKDFAHVRVADYTRAACVTRLENELDRASIVADDAFVPPIDHITQPKAVAALIHGVLLDLENEGILTGVAEKWPQYVSELLGTELRQATPIEMVDQLHNYMLRLDIVL
jgi:phage tail sheath gpL-like